MSAADLVPKPRERERLLLPGDAEFDGPFFLPFQELDDYEVRLNLLP